MRLWWSVRGAARPGYTSNATRSCLETTGSVTIASTLFKAARLPQMIWMIPWMSLLMLLGPVPAMPQAVMPWQVQHPELRKAGAELGSPAGDLIGAAERPDIDKQGLRAAGSSPDGSSAAEDIELDLSPTASPAALTSGKKSKKVNNSASSTKSGSHLH